MTGLAPHERTAFGLRLPSATHPELRLVKGRNAPRQQGHKAWNAGWLLMDFLQRHPLAPQARVLDVGCGWGLGGIFCARAFDARVTATDIDPLVFPFVDLHARLNDVDIATQPLDFSRVDKALLARHDIVIGADICFRQNMVQTVLQLVERALDAGVEQLLLADPGRPSFLALGRHCVEHMGASLQEWTTVEPLIAWTGQRPTIRGHLLLLGPWPTPSPA